MENLIKISMEVQQPEAQVEIDPELFEKFMQQIPIWDYSSISREGYVALPNFEKEALIRNYYVDMKSKGGGKFDNILLIMPRQFNSKESVKQIWMHSESKVMQGSFYCGKFGDCNKFIEIKNECKAKGLLTLRADVKNWEVVCRGKNKHFKIIPRDSFQLFS